MSGNQYPILNSLGSLWDETVRFFKELYPSEQQPTAPVQPAQQPTTSVQPVADPISNLATFATKLANKATDGKAVPEVRTKTTETKTKPTTETKTAVKTKKEKPDTSHIPKVVPKVKQVAPNVQPPQYTGTPGYVNPVHQTNGHTYNGVSISPVSVTGDNGGIQHAQMAALFQDPNAQPTPMQMAAYASMLNGRRTLGGIDEVTKAMQNADRMHAYSAQGNVANEVLRLLGEGRTVDEARYEALSNHLLDNGLSRAAISTTLPEFGRQADARAGRELDATIAAGGNYQTNAGLGYTPLGIRSAGYNPDKTAGYIDINGNVITNVPIENLGLSTISATGGNAPGAKGVFALEQQKAKFELDLARKFAAGEISEAEFRNGIKSGKQPLTPEQAEELERAKTRGKELGKQDAAAGNPGNTTGIKNLNLKGY